MTTDADLLARLLGACTYVALRRQGGRCLVDADGSCHDGPTPTAALLAAVRAQGVDVDAVASTATVAEAFAAGAYAWRRGSTWTVAGVSGAAAVAGHDPLSAVSRYLTRQASLHC